MARLFTLIDYTDPLGGRAFARVQFEPAFRGHGSLVDNAQTAHRDVNLTVGIPKWNGNVNADWNIDTVGDWIGRHSELGLRNWPEHLTSRTATNSDAVIFR
jgi:hypothetical protein